MIHHFNLTMPFMPLLTGLSNPIITTRTRLQLLIPIYTPETLVLRPPNHSHPLFNLPTSPRAWNSRRPFQFPLLVFLISHFLRCRRRSPQRSSRPRRRETQSCHV